MAEIEIEPLGNGRFRVSGNKDSGSGIRIAYGAVDRGPSTLLGAGRTWVFIDGRAYVVEAPDRDGTTRVRQTDDHLALSAPMPATVVSVKVTPGQQVAEGQLLMTLEAMKMELPIKAPRAGRVKSIACREGEIVQSGVALLELE